MSFKERRCGSGFLRFFSERTMADHYRPSAFDIRFSLTYGLKSLADSIQDKGNNRTRFICISKNLEIYPGSDKTSIMMILPHKPGSLYKVLARMYVLGINVIKLESRPIPDRDFEFMFYFDLETSIYSEEFVQLMCELDEMCEEFKYLGSYSEVI